MASLAPTVVTDDIKKLLDKAKIGLMQKPDSAFFTTIVFSLKFRWDDSQPTAYTDGVVLGFNSHWFKKLSPDERISLLVHEAMHVAYLHMDRLQDREADLFNQAADHVINLQLLARGFKLPPGCMDPRFKDMSTEEVYKVLLDEKKQGCPPPSNPMPDLRVPEKPDTLRKQVEDILVRARIHSQLSKDKPGTIPGDIELFLEKLLNPKLPWTTILRKYLSSKSKDDYSWLRFNRKHFPDYYMPSLYTDSLMDMTFACDISGSETDADFQRFVSEFTGVFRMMKPREMTLIQWDHEIKSVNKVRTMRQLSEIKFKGRGGTDIDPVLDWARKNKPQLLVVFSDGEFDPPSEPYRGNIIWIIHDNPNWEAPAFGKVIHFTTKD